MREEEGQPVNDSFEGRRNAYASFCPCSRVAAARIVRHKPETFEATIRRLTDTLIADLEKFGIPYDARMVDA